MDVVGCFLDSWWKEKNEKGNTFWRVCLFAAPFWMTASSRFVNPFQLGFNIQVSTVQEVELFVNQGSPSYFLLNSWGKGSNKHSNSAVSSSAHWLCHLFVLSQCENFVFVFFFPIQNGQSWMIYWDGCVWCMGRSSPVSVTCPFTFKWYVFHRRKYETTRERERREILKVYDSLTNVPTPTSWGLIG